MVQKTSKSHGGSSAAAEGQRITDSRFSKFETDPRFRLPSKHATRTKLDKRFGHVLKDKDFTETTQVDRYGRKLKSNKKKRALERLYDFEDEEEEGEGAAKAKGGKEGENGEKNATTKKFDPARGVGFLESDEDEDSKDSGKDDDDDDDDDSEDSDEDGSGSEVGPDTQQFREEEAEVPTGEVTRRIAVVNLDWDYIKSRDLMAMFASFVPENGRGRIERISIYPSQFGKERMQREEMEGPPREIFKNKGKDEEDDYSDRDSSDDSESDEEEDESEEEEKVKQDLLREEDDQDFNSNELRSYQLDRLRYYYAVIVCSDTATAEAIYNATDGHEYQASSNFIDLRFVPDDVTFDDDEPRDECTEVPTNYKPVDFVTHALQHSKVKLTWDMHPEDSSRKDLMRKAFSGTPAELIENDLRAYLASDSDSEGHDDAEVFEGFVENGDAEGDDADAVAQDGQPDGKPATKPSKKELARQKMRAALGLGEEPTPSSGGSSSRNHAPVGDMQITFTPALSGGAKADGGVEHEESTIEKYKRKEKERKMLRKQKAIAKREGHDPESATVVEDGGDAPGPEADLGFDDPFFTTDDPAVAGVAGGAGGAAAPAFKTAIRKEERLKKRAAREAEAQAKEASRKQLEKIMGGDGSDAKKGTAGHFDLREVMRAEKARKKEEKKKNKKGKKRRDDGDGEDGADVRPSVRNSQHDVDVSDPRLQAMFDQSEFAIDPSNPHYKDTLGLQQVLDEARRKRKATQGEGEGGGGKKAKTDGPDRQDELARLVASVKRRAKKNAQ